MAKGSIVVSLRSKGIPSFNRASFFDWRFQAVQFFTEFLDIFFSVFVTFISLSWTAWMGIIVSVVTLAPVLNTNWAGVGLEGLFPYFMYIFLPLLVYVYTVFGRRERAMGHIADLKATFVALLVGRPPGRTPAQREASEDLHRRAVAFLEDLHKYLQHRRPYARHFFLPFRTSDPTPNDELLKVSRELGLLLRRVHRGVRDMHRAVVGYREAGGADAEVAQLLRCVTALHRSTEQLMNIKEMRTPVVMRATIRWYVTVIMPISLAPFWQYVSKIMRDQRAFAGIMGVLTQVALMALVDISIALEDPFDDTSLDAISLYEVLDQIEVMTAAPTDTDRFDTLALGPEDPHAPQRSPGRDGGGGGGGDGHYQQHHVAMYVESGGGAEGEEDGGGGGTNGYGAAAGGGQAGAAVVSEGGAAGLAAGGGGAAAEAAGGAQAPPKRGAPAMRSSLVTSETAVGPPSAYTGAAGGGGGAADLTQSTAAGGGGWGGRPAGQQGGGGGGGALPGGVPSVNASLPEVLVPVKAAIEMPPMPALAGNPFRVAAVGGNVAGGM